MDKKLSKVRLRGIWQGWDGFNWYEISEDELACFIQSLEKELESGFHYTDGQADKLRQGITKLQSENQRLKDALSYSIDHSLTDEEYNEYLLLTRNQ